MGGLTFVHITVWLAVLLIQRPKAGLGYPDFMPKTLKYPDHVTLPDRAFLTIWNVPSARCEKFGIILNLSMFDIVMNSKQKFVGNQVTIFYGNDLGNYPRLKQDGSMVNGGVPQNDDLNTHLTKATKDIEMYIPDTQFAGIAVIDWEAWRPLWIRNFDSKDIYRKLSKKLVKQKHPGFNESTIDTVATEAFENASCLFMYSTLKTGTRLRPHGYWGYYGFPDCYNMKTPKNVCSRSTMHDNDRLSWMFNTSTALFPSIYLPSEDVDKLYVINKLKEAQRLSSNKPVYPYSRFSYSDKSHQLYKKEDLQKTIQISADMGTSGVVLWEPYSSFNTLQGCARIQKYLDSVLGPFVYNLTTFFQQCSAELCSAHGICVKNKSFGVGGFDIGSYSCKCNTGWYGVHCDR